MYMRLYVKADTKDKPQFHLPWNYHLSVINFIYQSIGEYNAEMASKLHQLPHSPPFSFSNFIQTGAFQPTEDGIMFSQGYFVFSSSNTEIIQSLSDAVPSGSDFMIGNTKIPVVNQDVDSVNGYSGETEYETLSPIAIQESHTPENRQSEWYMPSDSMWGGRIKESVKGNMKGENGSLPDNFRFKVVDIDYVDKKVKRLTSDIEIPCSRMKFTLDTDAETSKFIQNFGLGQRTGMGFGNVIPTQDREPKWC